MRCYIDSSFKITLTFTKQKHNNTNHNTNLFFIKLLFHRLTQPLCRRRQVLVNVAVVRQRVGARVPNHLVGDEFAGGTGVAEEALD